MQPLKLALGLLTWLVFCAASGDALARPSKPLAAQLACGPLTKENRLIEPKFSAKFEVQFENGRFSGERRFKKQAGGESFSGFVGSDDSISIAGNGAFDDPRRHRWIYTFEGRLSATSPTVLRGGIFCARVGVEEKMRVGDCGQRLPLARIGAACSTAPGNR